MPYLAAQYLQSYIWDGQVTADARSATVTYHGHTWVFRAHSRTARVDGAARLLPQAPLPIRGYLYLSGKTIAAITGWHVDYDPREDAVYIYSHREGESPPQAP
jgi:hypothetical protein